MGKNKNWIKNRDGSYDHVNKISYLTIDPDMDSTGEVFWVVHIKDKNHETYVDKFDTKKRAVSFSMTHMRVHPNG